MFNFVNPTICALAEAILRNSLDKDGSSLNGRYSLGDINEACLARLYSEYSQFVYAVEKKITGIFGDEWDSIDEFYETTQPVRNQAELDFVLTRNNAEDGFHDGDWMPCVSNILTDAAKEFSEICAFVGGDGKVYLY